MINWVGESLDLIFSLLGKYGRWQNNKRNKICFIIWMFCCGYWVIRDLYLNLWTQGIFCFVSLILHFHGYQTWKKHDKER